jgi:CRP-like cAMP-binding protein
MSLAQISDAKTRLRSLQSAQILIALSEIGRIESYASSHELIQTPASPSVFVVISGKIVSECISPSGRELGISTFESGDLVGLQILVGAKSVTRLIAIEETKVARIRVRELVALLLSRPDFCYYTLRAVLSQLTAKTEQLHDLMCFSLGQRLAMLLLGYAEDQEVSQGPLTLPMSQKMTAEMLGVSREAVNRELHKWESDGIIRREGRKISILSREKLDRLMRGCSVLSVR